MVNKSNTKWALVLYLIRNPEIKTSDLEQKGFNAQTIRRYRKSLKDAEKEYAGLK